MLVPLTRRSRNDDVTPDRAAEAEVMVACIRRKNEQSLLEATQAERVKTPLQRAPPRRLAVDVPDIGTGPGGQSSEVQEPAYYVPREEIDIRPMESSQQESNDTGENLDGVQGTDADAHEMAPLNTNTPLPTGAPSAQRPSKPEEQTPTTEQPEPTGPTQSRSQPNRATSTRPGSKDRLPDDSDSDSL